MHSNTALIERIEVVLQTAAQFLLDDEAPESPEWYDESTSTWHYGLYQ